MAVPVLWLCGPSGVGKTSVGYALFDQLSAAGVAVAYVDLDQLGLSLPAPADDPGNERVKARNLGEVYAGFRAAGAQCLVVSGILDDLGSLPDAALTVVRLRVGHDELRDRIARRGWQLELTEAAVRHAVELDGSDFADLVVDTDGTPVADVVTRIRDTGWPGRLTPGSVTALPPPDPGPVLWIYGPPAVGKSTVGFEIFLRMHGTGAPVAYVDLAQVGFCRAAPDGLGAYHADRLWRTFRAAGAEHLVVSGNVTGQSPPWTGCLLRARPDTLAERIRMRANGAGPALAGDELRGLPPAELPGRVAAAVRIAEKLDHTGGFRVDTDGLSVAQVADLVQACLTRPGGRAASGASPRTGIS